MYMAVVMLTMAILPLVSIAIEHAAYPSLGLLLLVGRWFVFWGVGVRLFLAGIRQIYQPAFTAREIFGFRGDEALPVICELGIANLAIGIVASLSLVFHDFVLAAAIYGSVFYGVAGVRHAGMRNRLPHQNIALISDLLIALVLLCFVGLRCMA